MFIILYVLYSGYSAPMAALLGTLACFPVALLRASTRQYVRLGNIIEAMIDGAKNALGVALACACAGVIIGVVTITGLGITFTQFVVGLAQSTLILALLLTMVAGIVLGMGMPTTPAYIIMTALLVPAIIKLGVVGAGRAHVRVLLRDPVRHHAAGGAGGVRGSRSRQGGSVEIGLVGGEDRRGRLHRALHVRVRAGHPDARSGPLRQDHQPGDRRRGRASCGRRARRPSAASFSRPAWLATC